MKIKLSEIKTELFTRVTLTDYGVRFEYYDKDKYESEKNKVVSQFGLQSEEKFIKHIHQSYFIICVHLLYNGSVNFTIQYNNHLSPEQIDEITRVSKILRSENK